MLPTQQQQNHKHFTIFSKKFDGWVKFYPLPNRKHPLLIDKEFSKNSGMIVCLSKTVCKNFKIFDETGKDF
jgi:hypothetical protein